MQITSPALGFNASALVRAEDKCSLHLPYNSLLVDTHRSWHNARSGLYPCDGRWASINPALVQGSHYRNDIQENALRCSVLNGCWPAPAMQHWDDIGPVYRVSTCIVVMRYIAKHDALTNVEWMLASTGDGRPALNRSWVSVVLTCSGHRHQLEIVMKIE